MAVCHTKIQPAKQSYLILADDFHFINHYKYYTNYQLPNKSSCEAECLECAQEKAIYQHILEDAEKARTSFQQWSKCRSFSHLSSKSFTSLAKVYFCAIRGTILKIASDKESCFSIILHLLQIRPAKSFEEATEDGLKLIASKQDCAQEFIAGLEKILNEHLFDKLIDGVKKEIQKGRYWHQKPAV